MKNIPVIGICGGSGSGKSTLAKRLAEYFGGKVAIIRQDDYYKPNDGISYEERRRINYDHPAALDNELLIRHLDALKRGETVLCPIYDYSRHTRSDETRRVGDTDAIILEGMLIFENEELLARQDLKIFVDTDADVRILRRITRDVKERGRSLDDVIEQYLATVKPMHDVFVEPTKRRADIIVFEGGLNVDTFEKVKDAVSALIK